jgi:hypothetical protein
MTNSKKTNLVLGGFILAAVFVLLPNLASAQEWIVDCPLTSGSDCPHLVTSGGDLTGDGFKITVPTGGVSFNSRDFGISSLDVAAGSFSVKVKGLDIMAELHPDAVTAPMKTFLWTIHLDPWKDKPSDFTFNTSFRNFPPTGGDYPFEKPWWIWLQDFGPLAWLGLEDDDIGDGWYEWNFEWTDANWSGYVENLETGEKWQTGNVVCHDLTPRSDPDQSMYVFVGGWTNPLFGPLDPNASPPPGVMYKDLHFEFKTGNTANPNIGTDLCLSEKEEDEEQDDPENPYDTCSCHSLTDLNAEPPCEDNQDTGDPKKNTFLSDFPFRFSKLTLDWLWDLGSIIKEGQKKQEQVSPLPEINLELGTPALKTGESAKLIAMPLGYRTRLQNIYFSWCTVIDGSAYPMNGIVAGGQSLPELVSPAKSWSDGGCCEPITRIPPDEYDYKGMDSRWVERHFLGRTINGVTYTDINQVDPNDDPDSDGYLANTFRNDDGEYLTLTPYLADKYGNTYNPAGEGSLTNIMEYILDTDPLNGDTSGDGFSDGMAFVGVGQTQLNFPVEKEAGPDGFYDVSVAALGISQAKKTAIVSAKRRVFVGTESALRVDLQADSDVITFDDSQTLTLKASQYESEEDSRNIFYEWSFNDQPACGENDSDFSELCDPGKNGGAGKDKVVLGKSGISFLQLPEPTSENYTISVKATSLSNGTQDTATIVLPVALPGSLTTADCAGQIEETYTLAAGNTSPLMVCVSEIGNLGDDLSDLNFIWTKDGVPDLPQSGLGKTQYALLPTKPAGSQHTLRLVIKKSSEAKELINFQQVFNIEGPLVEIVSPPRDDIAGESTNYITAEAGQNVDFVARVRNFNSLEGFDVTWSVEGEVIKKETIEQTETSASFTVPSDVSDGATYKVALQVASLEPGNSEQASTSLTLLVGPPGTQFGKADGFWGGLAAIFTTLPKVYPQIMLYIAIVAVVFFALVFVYPKIPRHILDKLPLGHRFWKGEYRSSGSQLRREKKMAQVLRRRQSIHFRDED